MPARASVSYSRREDSPPLNSQSNWRRNLYVFFVLTEVSPFLRGQIKLISFHETFTLSQWTYSVVQVAKYNLLHNGIPRNLLFVN